MHHKMTEEIERMVREHGPDGAIINVVRRVRIHRTEIQKPRVVAERRRWTKFGAAAGSAAGPEAGITIIRYALLRLSLYSLLLWFALMYDLLVRCSEDPTYLEFRDYDLEKEQASKPAETAAPKSGKYVPPSRC